jgi:hypothetical protein
LGGLAKFGKFGGGNAQAVIEGFNIHGFLPLSPSPWGEGFGMRVGFKVHHRALALGHRTQTALCYKGRARES